MKTYMPTADSVNAISVAEGAPEQLPVTDVLTLLGQRERARVTEIELLEANQRMEEALSITSHEIRTPLAALKGSVQLAARRVHSSARRVEAGNETYAQALETTEAMLSGMVRQIDRLNKLVDDLLDAARAKAGKITLALAPTDLAALVRGTIEEQRLAWPARSIRFDQPDWLTVQALGDARRIEQVLANYLTNALKYSPEDRPVTVSLDVGEREVRVSVRDEGPGVPASERERIWERFHQVDGIAPQLGADKRTGTGLGLGLYLCRSIIERHQGRVGVECAPGQGSTFWFALPVHDCACDACDRDGEDD